MEITVLIAAVAALGLPCSNPVLRDYPAVDLPWSAAYVRTIEGQNIIMLREGIRTDTQRLPKILVHELLHCGLYEDGERRGQPQLPSLDPREEMVVQAMTEVVLKRLSGSEREKGAWLAATTTHYRARVTEASIARPAGDEGTPRGIQIAAPIAACRKAGATSAPLLSLEQPS